MKTLKITDTPREVYYSRTIQFSAEVEDKELTFRYWEDNNGTEFYILKEDNWIIAPEEYTWIEDLCTQGVIYEEMEIGETAEEDC
jgi:hypothetical protein